MTSFQQFFAGLLFAVGLLSPRRDAQVQFLMLQIKMLKGRLRSDRVVPTPEEKAELLRLGGTLQDDISDIIAIVKPETYRKWRAQSKDGKVAKRSGPPGLVAEIKELICTLAKDNVLWGYRRIVGELKKLGHVVAPSSVKRVMAAHDLHPSPTKSGPKPPIPWTTFVHAHMETMVAVDFFTKPIYTLWGRYEAFLLVFIHLNCPLEFFWGRNGLKSKRRSRDNLGMEASNSHSKVCRHDRLELHFGPAGPVCPVLHPARLCPLRPLHPGPRHPAGPTPLPE